MAQLARCAQVRAWYQQLLAADLGLAQGTLAPGDHEAVWHDVYRRVDSELARP